MRSLLETPERKFVLCLPPRTKLIEPALTLFKAGLSPASNVLFAWIESGEKGTIKSTPSSVLILTFLIQGQDLKQEYLDMIQDLTPAVLPQPSSVTTNSSSTSSSTSNTKSSSSKPIPKWLQKGLFNKKK